MFSPDTIDLKALPWLPLDEKASFPKKAVIYFAVDSLSQIQYIGRSVNCRQRWSDHHQYQKLTDIGEIKIHFLFVDSIELLEEIEAALIQWFDPPLNVQLKTLYKSSADKLINTGSKGNDKRLVAYVSQELFQELEILAANEDRSTSNFTRNLIASAVEQYKKDKNL
jgi:CopG-like RHH_1 or ribbon-helix-helix domain, RHH_5